MKIPSKYILNLIVANLFWSFIPIVVTGLFTEISILTIIFLHFLISGIILFFSAILIVLINNAINKEKKISIKEIIFNLRHKNKRFYNIRTSNTHVIMKAWEK
jgi:hypothetical protein